MSARLKFSLAALLPLIEHTEKATEHTMPYGYGTPEPGLFFVKDSGIYLMSNAKEKLPGDKTMNKVVYAKGFDPDKDEDVWERSVDAVGGDDFAEHFPIKFFRDAVTKGCKTVTIVVKKTSIELVAEPGK